MPVPLDELQDRDVIGVSVVDVATLPEGGDDDERNARAVAEEVERLDVAGVIVAAAFVEGDDKRGAFEKFLVALQVIHDLIDHALEQIELRGGRVPVEQAVGLDE